LRRRRPASAPSEARYFKNKYDHVFTVEPASNAKTTIEWLQLILKEERDIVISEAGARDGKADFQRRDISAANDAFERGRRAGWRQGGDRLLDEVHAALHGGRDIRDAD
jgi:hypothetical protein